MTFGAVARPYLAATLAMAPVFALQWYLQPIMPLWGILVVQILLGALLYLDAAKFIAPKAFGELRRVLSRPIRNIGGVTFSPDGKTLAVGDYLGRVALYDADALTEDHFLGEVIVPIASLTEPAIIAFMSSGGGAGMPDILHIILNWAYMTSYMTSISRFNSSSLIPVSSAT